MLVELLREEPVRPVGRVSETSGQGIEHTARVVIINNLGQRLSDEGYRVLQKCSVEWPIEKVLAVRVSLPGCIDDSDESCLRLGREECPELPSVTGAFQRYSP